MAKQKIVIKVAMPTAKTRAHAMALAAKQSGVSSVGITGDQKDQLEVGGEGIDVVCLVNRLREDLCIIKCLRKKLCHAEILKVEEVKPEQKKKPDEKKKEEPKPCTCPPGTCRCAGYYPMPMVLCEEPPAGTCHIM
ncbi:unnamed protein product [Urochloa humidicola]